MFKGELGNSAELEKILLAEPQGICDIIGSAFRTWRQNFGLIVKVLITPTILFTVCNTFFQWLVTYGPELSSNNLFQGVTIFILGLVVSLVWLVVFYILGLRKLAILRLLCGFSPDWDSAYRFMRKRLWWMVGLSALGFFGAVLALTLLGILLGISVLVSAQGTFGAVLGSIGVLISSLGMIFIFVALLLLFSIGAIVVALEDINFWDVVGRTFHWTFNNFWRVMCFGTVSYVVLTAVAIPVQIPVLAVSVVDIVMHIVSGGISSAESYKAPLYVMVFNQLWEAISSMFLRPVALLCFAFFYLDLRRRVDGIDIDHRLQLLKKLEAN